MKKHTLRLLSGPSERLRVPADALANVLRDLMEGARRAVRYAAEGESVRRGSRPGWLDAATTFDVTGLRPGSAVVELEAPVLREAAPDQFDARARGLFLAAAAERTAIDCFTDVLSAALNEPPEALNADRQLVDACVAFAKNARRFESMAFDGLSGREASVVVRAEDVPMLEGLRDRVPPASAVRLTGQLDTISATRPDVVLRTGGGQKIRARVERHDPEKLRALFGRRVVVSGLAHYRPSGEPSVIDVEHLALAGTGDVLFDRSPIVRSRQLLEVATTEGEGGGVAAFFGTWPGEETPDELLASLAELRAEDRAG